MSYRYRASTPDPERVGRVTGGGAGRANVPDDLRVASGPVSTRATAWSLIGLLAVAAAWGSSFPLTKALLDRMTPLNFLAVRFTLAALIIALIFAKSLHKLSRRTWTRGVWLGLAFASGRSCRRSDCSTRRPASPGSSPGPTWC